jgi:hypothetical protein
VENSDPEDSGPGDGGGAMKTLRSPGLPATGGFGPGADAIFGAEVAGLGVVAVEQTRIWGKKRVRGKRLRDAGIHRQKRRE